MKLTQMVINIQSYTDIITNSSTEVFIAADGSTIAAIKEIINSLYAMLVDDKDPQIADKLFTVTLGEADTSEWHNYHDRGYIVTPKDPDNHKAKRVATALSNLTQHFSINAEYC